MSILVFDSETQDCPNNPYYEEMYKIIQDKEMKAAERDKRDPNPIQPALWPQLSKIVGIGWQFDDNPIEVIVEDEGINEIDIINKFLSIAFRGNYQIPDAFVGFNCISFDFPVLRYRCMINKIRFPYMDIKPWENKVIDLYAIWKSQTGGSLGLKQQCLGMGIESLTPGVTGANLPETPQGRRDYLTSDVYQTGEWFKYMNYYGGFIPPIGNKQR